MGAWFAVLVLMALPKHKDFLRIESVIRATPNPSAGPSNLFQGLYAWNKVIFGNGNGPSPLPGEERYVVIKLDQTRVTKEEARKMVLQIIDTEATALTKKPPYAAWNTRITCAVIEM